MMAPPRAGGEGTYRYGSVTENNAGVGISKSDLCINNTVLLGFSKAPSQRVRFCPNKVSIMYQISTS